MVHAMMHARMHARTHALGAKASEAGAAESRMRAESRMTAESKMRVREAKSSEERVGAQEPTFPSRSAFCSCGLGCYSLCSSSSTATSLTPSSATAPVLLASLFMHLSPCVARCVLPPSLAGAGVIRGATPTAPVLSWLALGRQEATLACMPW